MSKVITRSEHFVEIDDVEYEIRLEPEHGTDIEHRKLDDGRMVIGYLMHDDDCANPLEDCDGMGHIHSFGRRHRNNISPDDVPGMKHSEYAVPLSYFEHGLCKWGVAGSRRMTKREFINENRAEIEAAINNVLGGKKPAHYLAYGG